MSIVVAGAGSPDPRRRPPWARRRAAGGLYAAACLLWLGVASAPAGAADPAVQFMAKVGRELMAAARSPSPGQMAGVFQRYADVSYIGLFSLGSYRDKLSAAERTIYYAGMVRFIGRYAASEAPKYQVTKVEWSDQSFRGANGTMVDCRITLEDGRSYDVRWLLVRHRDTFKVRDAMVLGVWMTPFLKNLFEGYIAQNGGNPRALVAALSR
jgi:phospholipid transport system substrate-binding protein